MRTINLLVIHCSASKNGDSLYRTPHSPAQTIDAWHLERGFSRAPDWRRRFNAELSAIGYHYVIQVDGRVASGRHPDEIGAHAQGCNAHSLGICLVGTDRFALAQWHALTALLADLNHDYPDARVCGHRDLPKVNKSCPGFDVAMWIQRGMKPESMHIFP